MKVCCIDAGQCEGHPYPRSVDEIHSYITEPWKSRCKGIGRGFCENPVHGSKVVIYI